MAENDDDQPIELNISLEKIHEIALAARESVSPAALKYLNRLSDLLFILGRVANEPGGDLLWKPGGDR